MGGGRWGGGGRDALEGKGPQRRPQKWLDRGSEEVAKAVGTGDCRLQMPPKLALAVSKTVAGCRLGALEGDPSLLLWLSAVLIHPWELRNSSGPTMVHVQRSDPFPLPVPQDKA